jgi:histone H2A
MWNFKLVVLQADIVNVCVDAIVHPTNATFHLGGQVGQAVATKGGMELRNAVADLQRSHGSLGVCQGNFQFLSVRKMSLV